ncbi:PepSY domain-containing protein [Streptomyces sp. NPDC001401]|uniref:PepSY domain-containing protein n=1 Tax=Streptomyces sp. NPDC001401 TaxID=3364570 RepID=UPI0036B53B7E
MKRNIVIATVAAAALVGGGTAAAFAVGGGDAAPTKRQASLPAAASGKVTAAGAIAAALQHTPGTAVAADRDDDGTNAWEVDVVKGDGAEYTVRVSPTTGKVVGAHRDTDDGSDDLAALKGTGVDAREAALAVAPKGTVTEVDRDDDGPAAWSVETPKGEWKVDAHTGKVTQDHKDADHDGRGDDD